MLDDNAVITLQEITEKVNVPVVVEDYIRDIIEGALNKCGIYYRIFRRVKIPKSIERKLNDRDKQYNEQHKMQDLIGFRIVMYFEDDLEICQEIMKKCFEEVEWSVSSQDESEFKPIKINGIFNLPKYISDKISEATWELPIDKTLEIQFKTVFFEGWHEIEHDMRYKGYDLWKTSPDLSRKFNSVLATLELCDDTIVSLFEDLGHSHYKKRNWTSMIRSHYRIRMADENMLNELRIILNNDTDLAKAMFKLERNQLMAYLMDYPRPVPLNVNSVIGLINEKFIKNPEISKVIAEKGILRIRHEDDGKELTLGKLAPLKRYNVFQSYSYLVGGKEQVAQTFIKACSYVYDWMKIKFSDVFPDLPDKICTYYREIRGFRVRIIYDEKNYSLKARISHPDTSVASKMWLTDAKIENKDGRLLFIVENSYAEPESRHDNNETVFFSRPGFYGKIAENVGIMDVRTMLSKPSYISLESKEMLADLINYKTRFFPVVVICCSRTPDEDGKVWMDAFRGELFANLVGYYAHVFEIDSALADVISEDMGEDTIAGRDCVRVFWPEYTREAASDESRYQLFTLKEILDCSYEILKPHSHAESRYRNATGPNAFRHQLVADIRQQNLIIKRPILEEEAYDYTSSYNAITNMLSCENEELRDRVDELQKELYAARNLIDKLSQR